MNKLAEKLGKDPVELRLQNIMDEDKLLPVGTTNPGGVSMDQVIREVAWKSNWSYPGKRGENNPDYPEELPRFVKGRAFAAGFKNIGFSFCYQENSWAEVELRGETDIEEAVLRIAGADVGQGDDTVLAQIAVHTRNIYFEQLKLEVYDTAFTLNTGRASATRRFNSLILATASANCRCSAATRASSATRACTCVAASSWRDSIAAFAKISVQQLVPYSRPQGFWPACGVKLLRPGVRNSGRVT